MGRIPRVMHVIYGLQVGGRETLLLGLLPVLKDQGVDVALHVLSKGGPLEEEALGLGIDAYVDPDARLGVSRGKLVRLYGQLRRVRPDVVHIHLPDSWVWQAAAEIAWGPRILLHFHMRDMHYSRLNRWRHGFWARRADATVACSEALRDHYVRLYRLDPSRAITVRNGVDVSRFSVRYRDGAERQAGTADRPLVLGSLGRLHEQKGYDVLLHALAQIDVTPACRLSICGTGSQESELRRLASELGSSDRVSFDSIAPAQVPGFLQTCDLYVQPSRWEGLPIALLEAMASGLPVVASDVEGVREAVLHERTGLLVPPGDPGTLAQAIRDMLASPGDRARMGNAGRERAVDHLSIESMARQLMEFYSKLVVR